MRGMLSDLKRPIRIVVVGDDGVGKSSLVSTFISGSFPENPPVSGPTNPLEPPHLSALP
jgi:GTPase SAR1 family protein